MGEGIGNDLPPPPSRRTPSGDIQAGAGTGTGLLEALGDEGEKGEKMKGLTLFLCGLMFLSVFVFLEIKPKTQHTQVTFRCESKDCYIEVIVEDAGGSYKITYPAVKND